MVAELDILNEWIPEQMQPGTVFVLENAGQVGEKEDPYWAVLACPSCGMLGLITRRQINGLIPVICGSENCSAQFFIPSRGSTNGRARKNSPWDYAVCMSMPKAAVSPRPCCAMSRLTCFAAPGTTPDWIRATLAPPAR